MSRLLRGILLLSFLLAACGLLTLPFSVHAQSREFVKLFDGTTLNGWTLVGGAGPGYVPRDGILDCPADGGGNLFTEKEYSDYVFRFEFKLFANSNNGVGIRAPLQGDAAYMGMECQVLDDSGSMYTHLEAGQYHSSLYKIVAARRGALKPVGEWNREEITAIGRRIKVVVNGKVTVDANLNDVNDPAILAAHPGMLRDRGHVGFLGHGPSEVQFRNIYIKDLSRPQRENAPPMGFKALFNGRSLKGWKGLVGDPVSRAKMTPDQLKTAQVKASEAALKHWVAENGEIVYDGKNNSLCTAKDYKDFEMLVDWKIEPKGDSGIYLRGSPQVQIWDNPLGSGGLYNNHRHPDNPTHKADNPVGEWNRFRILMVGDKVTVYLNNELVTHNIEMENYWTQDFYKTGITPMYPSGQIELQHHSSPLHFKNIYIREIKTREEPGAHAH